MNNGTRMQFLQDTYSDSDRIGIALTLFRIGGIILLLVIFNVYPSRIGILLSATDASSFVPLAGPRFQEILPWLNAWWGMALALNFAHLGLRRWTVFTRWADWGLTLFGAIILLMLILRGPLIGADTGWAATGNPLLQIGQDWLPLLNTIVRIFLVVAFVATAISAIRKLLYGLRRLGYGTAREVPPGATRDALDAADRPADGSPRQRSDYQALGVTYGLILGVPLGLVFGMVLGNMAFMGIGIGAGMAIGVAVATGLERQHNRS